MRPPRLPAHAGVGYRPEHFAPLTTAPRPIGFLEIHAENFLGAGGLPHAQLTRLRRDFPLSVHGVGLSIGSGSLDSSHLARVRALCDRYEPECFSEHLAWSSHGTVFLNALLPLPLTEQNLACVVRHVDQVQDGLGRRMLLENPASCLAFDESAIPEPAFLAEVARRTGCGLLLDLNNVFISTHNRGEDPLAYLAAFPLHEVGEIHLAGHALDADGTLLVDTHDGVVAAPVWALFRHVVGRLGAVATLVEWDHAIPHWPVLLREAEAAQAILDQP